MFLTAALLILSVASNVFLMLKCFQLLEINEEYEDFFTHVQTGIEKTITNMKLIDRTGAFESDDEVGEIFNGLKGMITSLSGFLDKE